VCPYSANSFPEGKSKLCAVVSLLHSGIKRPKRATVN
jgi:hypothetical protein